MFLRDCEVSISFAELHRSEVLVSVITVTFSLLKHFYSSEDTFQYCGFLMKSGVVCHVKSKIKTSDNNFFQWFDFKIIQIYTYTPTCTYIWLKTGENLLYP